MIKFLKDSTFAINKVLVDSWNLMQTRYFTIVGINIILVVVSVISAMVAGLIRDVNWFLSFFLALVFLVAYFGTQMTLYKFILRVVDHSKDISWREAFPTFSELRRMFLGMIYIVLISFALYLAVSVLFWPLIYVVGVDQIMRVNVLVFPVILFFFMIRIVFFPFFILDQNRKTWESIKFSVALTKGNLTNLFLLFLFFTLVNSLVVIANYFGYVWVSLILTVVMFLVVVPWVSVAITLAYREMVQSKDPNFEHVEA